MEKECILVVDDDPQVTSFLKRYLSKHEYSVICASTGSEMERVLAHSRVDLCILDVGLPGRNGLDITRDLRKTSNLPILILSGQGDAFDRVVGLEFGADDYLTKPYEPRELLARVRTILRRSRAGALAEQQQARGARLFRFANWTVNLDERSLQDAQSGEAVKLTTTEFELLSVFVQNPHVVHSRYQLLDQARGRESYSRDRAIDVHVTRLRKKIEPDPSDPVFIKTVHGIGYSFVANVASGGS